MPRFGQPLFVNANESFTQNPIADNQEAAKQLVSTVIPAAPQIAEGIKTGNFTAYQKQGEQWKKDMISPAGILNMMPGESAANSGGKAAKKIIQSLSERLGVRPAFIPKDVIYKLEIQKHIQEWGQYAFSTKHQAEVYADALKRGEGGTWVAEKYHDGWRAHKLK